MTVPELPAFDARSFTKRLHERVLKADGGAYPVFDPASPTGLPVFVDALRKQQDVVERHDVQLGDHKAHLDSLDAREAAHHQAQAARLTALEEAVAQSPFPA